MRISQTGIDLIKRFEGCRLDVYKCPAGIWTQGYGSTGAHVKPGVRWTQAQADARLTLDLMRFERGVELLAGSCTQAQFDALVSFAFNLGLSAFKGSTLLRKHNKGDHEGAAVQFARWNKAGGKVLAGLTKRRTAEALLYANKVVNP